MQRSKSATPAPDHKASTTALSVANSLVRFLAINKDPTASFDRCELNLMKHIVQTAMKAESSYVRWGLSKAIYGMPYAAQRMLFNAAIISHYDFIIGTRKIYTREKMKAAGVEQIIMLGGGYDTAAFLASLRNGVKVFELDRGQTRLNKLQALLSIPSTVGLPEIKCQTTENGTCIINDNFYSIECDISNGLEKALIENGFRQGVKTLVIGEGLTMYLTEEVNRQLLTSLHKLLTEEDEVMLGYLSHTDCSAVLKSALKSAGEPANFSLLPEAVLEFVGQFGFDVVEKSFMESRIGFVSNPMEVLDFHIKNEKQPQEQFYVLQSSPHALKNEKDILEIPEFVLAKPEGKVEAKLN